MAQGWLIKRLLLYLYVLILLFQLFNGAQHSNLNDKVKIIQNILCKTKNPKARIYIGKDGMSGSSAALSEKEVQDILNPTTFKQLAREIFYNTLYPGIKEGSFIEVRSILLQDVINDIKKSLGKKATIVIKSDLEGSDCKVLLGSSGIFSDSEVFIPYLLVEWFGDSLMTSCSGEVGNEVIKMLLEAGFDKAYKVR